MTNDATIARFDAASRSYRTDSIRYRKLSADLVSKCAAPSAEDVILDIGCGTGEQLLDLAGVIRSGIGIDISRGMVEVARERCKEAGCGNIAFYNGDFLAPERECSLRTQGITTIISNYALHHLCLADKKRAIEQLLANAGEQLARIVIGDLMFFEEPAGYLEQYGEVGYGPGADQPCYAEELARLFDQAQFTVKLDQLHPLVGVLTATRYVRRRSEIQS